MRSSLLLSREQADQLLRWLKDFRASGGVIAINDLQCYLHQCLRAQALQGQGFKARVRGQWQHWLLVVEGGKRTTTTLRARGGSPSRRLRVIRNRGALQSKPHLQQDTTGASHRYPWLLD